MTVLYFVDYNLFNYLVVCLRLLMSQALFKDNLRPDLNMDNKSVQLNIDTDKDSVFF